MVAARLVDTNTTLTMAARLMQRLLTILLIDASLGWTLVPSTRPPTPSLLTARVSAVTMARVSAATARVSAATMNAAEEAKIRKSLGGEMPSDRHGAAAAAAGGDAAAAAAAAAAAPKDAPVEVGAEAEAAARQASFEEAQELGTQPSP